MLYLSKMSGNDEYAVVDTDDGQEEWVSYADLERAHALGLDIRGVDWDIGPNGEDLIVGIQPYQNPAHVTSRQVKAMLMSGIDVRTVGDMISYVSFDPNIYTGKTAVRLSDFGTCCAESIFNLRFSGPKLKVILDDKITVSPKTFRGVGDTAVLFDLREVSLVKTVQTLYMEAIEHHRMFDDIIVDSPERMNKYIAVAVVYCGGWENDGIFDDSITFAEQFFIDRIKALLTQPIAVTDAGTSRSYYIKLLDVKDFWRTHPQNFRDVQQVDKYMVIRLLVNCVATVYSMRHWHNIKYLRSYLQHFDRSEEMRSLYVQICNRVYNWFFDYAEEAGW